MVKGTVRVLATLAVLALLELYAQPLFYGKASLPLLMAGTMALVIALSEHSYTGLLKLTPFMLLAALAKSLYFFGGAEWVFAAYLFIFIAVKLFCDKFVASYDPLRVFLVALAAMLTERLAAAFIARGPAEAAAGIAADYIGGIAAPALAGAALVLLILWVLRRMDPKKVGRLALIKENQ